MTFIERPQNISAQIYETAQSSVLELKNKGKILLEATVFLSRN